MDIARTPPPVPHSLSSGRRLRPERGPKRPSESERGWGPASSENSRHDLVRAGVAGVAAFVIGYLPQLLAYKALNGKFGPSPLVTRKMYWNAPHALQVLADLRAKLADIEESLTEREPR